MKLANALKYYHFVGAASIKTLFPPKERRILTQYLKSDPRIESIDFGLAKEFVDCNMVPSYANQEQLKTIPKASLYSQEERMNSYKKIYHSHCKP